MRSWSQRWIVVIAAAAVGFGLSFVLTPRSGEAQARKAQRMPDGKPNLNGVWQAMNTANWDIQDHGARPGPVAALGASFSVPAGEGVVEGNAIPYLPDALSQKKA